MTAPRLQPLARARAGSLGERGAAWQAGLPATLDDLAERWSLRWGAALPGGSASYVVSATTAAGEARVVKMLMPDQDAVAEAAVLVAAGGRGYASIHDVASDHGALLLEALGGSLDHTAPSPASAIATLADTLRVAWSLPLETVAASAPGQDKATHLRDLVRATDDRLGRVCHPAVRRLALEIAERRIADVGRVEEVVVHGDPHPGNALRVRAPRAGAGSGWVLVDPDGLRCDPAYDAGVVLRGWTTRLRGSDARRTLEGYCDLLAGHTGLPWTRIWEWGFLERVSTGLYVWGFGADRLGREYLDSAAALLRGGSVRSTAGRGQPGANPPSGRA